MGDADKIYGCICDEGFEGYDCSHQSCPKGADPLATGVDEKQIIECSADGGTITLGFRGEWTSNLPYSVTAGRLTYELELLSTVHKVTVAYHETAGGLCEADGGGALITFTQNPGDLPDIVIYSAALTSSASVATSVISGGGATTLGAGGQTSVTGTKVSVECSNRG